jgi:hypothetical protein
LLSIIFAGGQFDVGAFDRSGDGFWGCWSVLLGSSLCVVPDATFAEIVFLLSDG